MKLPIKKEFFDKIKNGEKQVEFRDAHITFVCIETGEKHTRKVRAVGMMDRTSLPDELWKRWDLFEDKDIIRFVLGDAPHYEVNLKIRGGV